MWVRVGVASGLRLWFMSSFETIGVTVKKDFVSVGWIRGFVLVRVCVRADGKIWGSWMDTSVLLLARAMATL